MNLGVVRALISASGWPDLVDDTVAAVRAQPEPPASIAVHPSMNAGAAMVRALERGADWLWLLDGLTVPEPGALRGFAGALEALSGYPEPFVLQSKILDGVGALHPDALPRHQIFERRCTVAAVERGLVQIRAAPSGSLLVRREAFARTAAPRTDLSPSWQAFDFTARVLRALEDTGYLVPSSVAVRRVPPRPARLRGGASRARAGVLAGSGFGPRERLWEGFMLAERILKDAREPAPRASARRGRRARRRPGSRASSG